MTDWSSSNLHPESDISGLEHTSLDAKDIGT